MDILITLTARDALCWGGLILGLGMVLGGLGVVWVSIVTYRDEHRIVRR